MSGIEVGVDEAGEPVVLTAEEFTRLSIVAAGDDPGEIFAAVLEGEFLRRRHRDLTAEPFGRSGGDAA